MNPRVIRRLCSALIGLASACAAPNAHANWFGDGVPLCTESDNQLPYAIVSHGASGATVIWQDDRYTSYDVFGQRVNASGVVQWSTNGLAICTDASHQFVSTALPAGTGDVVIWTDFRNSSLDIYAQRVDAQGLALWAFDGIALGGSGRSENNPRLVTDGSTGAIAPIGWIACWRAEGGGSTDTELRAQHVDGNGAGMWTPAATGGISLVSTPATISGHSIASDGVFGITRGAVVAWSEERGVNGNDIYARRVDASGVPQWTANGHVVCDVTGAQTAPAIASVGSANTILAWEDVRTPDRNLWAQKLNSSGVDQWAADGVPVCQASGSQNNVQLIPDNAGGAFIVWQDLRLGTTVEIFAQRLDGNGVRQWMPLDGIPVCTAPGSSVSPVITSDGAGGLIVAWADDRNGPRDIFAQRVNASGSLLWGASGIPVALARRGQTPTAIASDGASGAYVTWVDDRDSTVTNDDVYVQRIFADGTLDAPGPQPLSTLRLALASSNPTRGEVRMVLELPVAGLVSVDVLDLFGRRVRTLELGAEFGAGAHSLRWDGEDEAGALTAPGVFFVRVRAGGEVRMMRVVRLL